MLWDFSIARAFGLVLRTWPFLLLRLVVYGVFTVIFIILLLSGGLIGHQLLPLLFDWMIPTHGAIFGGLGGLALGGLVLQILREYSLYMVKASHVAVMVELMDNGELPNGRSQLGFGWQQVQDRFAQASILFAIDQLIKAALAAIRDATYKITAFVPGLRLIASLLQAVADVAVGYVDEIVLAHNLRTRSTNPWQTSADAIVLYAQNGGAMLKNAAWLALFLLLAGIAVFTLVNGPVFLLVSDLVGPAQFYGLAASLIVTILLIQVLLEPFAVCALMSVYFERIDGQTPDATWEQRLHRATPALATLRDNGADAAQGDAQPI